MPEQATMPDVAMGAIFRDEVDYVVEWLAWHELAGFKKFYICDNGSTDGTREMLEALSEIMDISVIYQPVVESKAQITAYSRVSQAVINDGGNAVLYIDADEFLVHDSMADGAEHEELSRLLSDETIGMVGINWRTFGSSGHKTFEPSPVLERFFMCCADRRSSRNSPIKSVTKVRFSKFIDVHDSVMVSGLKRVDCTGAAVEKMYNPSQKMPRFIGDPTPGPLRIHHYVIKSFEEYTEKKRKRGDAILGAHYDRGSNYFHAHDFSEAEFRLPHSKLDTLRSRIDFLNAALKNGVSGRALRGFIDVSDGREISGWLVDEAGSSRGLEVNVFLNEVFQGRARCGFYRPDLKDNGISHDGLAGFRWTHPKPLSHGDVVEVLVHGNRFKFPNRKRTVID